VPLHTPTSSRRAALTRAAIIAAAVGIAAGGTAIAISEAQTTRPAITRYDDIEANKADSMRALGLTTMQAHTPSPYHDLEANKARSLRRAR
jgi:hypothetical protein